MKKSLGLKPEKKPTAWSGNFGKLQNYVAASYEEKGMPLEKAKAIGAAVAAKQGVAKFGQKAMTKAAVKWRTGKGGWNFALIALDRKMSRARAAKGLKAWKGGWCKA